MIVLNILYIVCIIVLLIFSFELFAIYYVVPVEKYDNTNVIEGEHSEHTEIKPYAIIDDEII